VLEHLSEEARQRGDHDRHGGQRLEPLQFICRDPTNVR